MMRTWLWLITWLWSAITHCVRVTITFIVRHGHVISANITRPTSHTPSARQPNLCNLQQFNRYWNTKLFTNQKMAITCNKSCSSSYHPAKRWKASERRYQTWVVLQQTMPIFPKTYIWWIHQCLPHTHCLLISQSTTSTTPSTLT